MTGPVIRFSPFLAQGPPRRYGAYGVVVGLEPITDTVLADCPDLQIVSKYGVGLDNIDQAACADRQVHIGWTGGVNRRGVAEMALCYMIGLSRNILFYYFSVWSIARI